MSSFSNDEAFSILMKEAESVVSYAIKDDWISMLENIEHACH